MYFLQLVKDDSRRIPILCDEIVDIGRSRDERGILIPDNSVSRKHASVRVVRETGEGETGRHKVFLQDSSKIGTFVAGDRIIGREVEVKPGEAIIFGAAADFKYQLVEERLVVCSSCLKPEQKERLEELLAVLGGRLAADWSAHECTHLCMDALTITVKAVNCLLACAHIVTLDYFQELLSVAKERKVQLVSPRNFLPPVAEPCLVGEQLYLYPCDQRKTLFSKKWFYFFDDKQLEKHMPMIVQAGGGGQLVIPSLDVTMNLCRKEAIVILPFDPSTLNRSTRTLIANVEAKLKRNGWRLVEEQDISLAVLFISTEKYCCNRRKDSTNPKEHHPRVSPAVRAVSPTLGLLDGTEEVLDLESDDSGEDAPGAPGPPEKRTRKDAADKIPNRRTALDQKSVTEVGCRKSPRMSSARKTTTNDGKADTTATEHGVVPRAKLVRLELEKSKSPLKKYSDHPVADRTGTRGAAGESTKGGVPQNKYDKRSKFMAGDEIISKVPEEPNLVTVGRSRKIQSEPDDTPMKTTKGRKQQDIEGIVPENFDELLDEMLAEPENDGEKQEPESSSRKSPRVAVQMAAGTAPNRKRRHIEVPTDPETPNRATSVGKRGKSMETPKDNNASPQDGETAFSQVLDFEDLSVVPESPPPTSPTAPSSMLPVPILVSELGQLATTARDGAEKQRGAEATNARGGAAKERGANTNYSINKHKTGTANAHAGNLDDDDCDGSGDETDLGNSTLHARGTTAVRAANNNANARANTRGFESPNNFDPHKLSDSTMRRKRLDDKDSSINPINRPGPTSSDIRLTAPSDPTNQRPIETDRGTAPQKLTNQNAAESGDRPAISNNTNGDWLDKSSSSSHWSNGNLDRSGLGTAGAMKQEPFDAEELMVAPVAPIRVVSSDSLMREDRPILTNQRRPGKKEGGVNFKRFKKIYPCASSDGPDATQRRPPLVRIIGGRDLFVHVNGRREDQALEDFRLEAERLNHRGGPQSLDRRGRREREFFEAEFCV